MNIPIKNITDVPTPPANTAYIFVDKSDNNLKIKKQSEIVTYIPGVDTSDATVTVNDVLAPKVFYGKDGKQVGAIPTVTPSKTDTLLSIPSGFLQKPYTLTLENSTDLSFITATSDTILRDYVSVDEYGNKITGSIPTVTPTLNENVFTVSKGYVESDAKLVVPTVAAQEISGKVIVPVGYISKEQTFTIDAGPDLNFITATSDKILNGFVGSDKDGKAVTGNIPTVTPTLEENTFSIKKGYVENDTTLSVNRGLASLASNIVDISPGYYEQEYITVGTAKASETYIPSTSDQTIAPGLFLTGPQIIKGDANLTAENIVKGKTIFGVDGAANTQETFYKCAEVIEGTVGGYIVSGAGSAEANGTYDNWDSNLGWRNMYSCFFQQGSDGTWSLYDQGWQERYKTTGTDITSDWVVAGYGAAPVPTVLIAGTSASWSGYLANTDEEGNWTFSSTLTTNLKYSGNTPEVGKIYNENASVVINPESGKTDLSFVTVTSDKMLAGSVGVDKDGNRINGSIPVLGEGSVAFMTAGTFEVTPGYYPQIVVKTIPEAEYTVNGGSVVINNAGWMSTGTITAGSSMDLSFVTATASEIIRGYTGADKDGNPVEGNVPINNQDNIEINIQGTMTVNAGVYPAFTKELDKAQLAIHNNGIVADQAGWVDSSYYRQLDVGSTSVNNNVVTITRGWHEDKQVEVGATYPGTTITPDTNEQIIPAQSYLLGDVVIPGSNTFIEENIKDGVTIWGKTGTYKGEQTTDEELVGMLVDGPNGELMFQKLRFEGTTSFADGEPIAIEGTYIYNTASPEEEKTCPDTDECNLVKCNSCGENYCETHDSAISCVACGTKNHTECCEHIDAVNGEHICDKCAESNEYKCDKCDNVSTQLISCSCSAKVCPEHTGICQECGDKYCTDCFTEGYCPICSEKYKCDICSTFDNNIVNCTSCGKKICSSHKHICAEAEHNEVVCSDCLVKCTSCGKQISKNCTGSNDPILCKTCADSSTPSKVCAICGATEYQRSDICQNCGNDICTDCDVHITSCMYPGCEKQILCGTCQKTCEECWNVFCEEHFNKEQHKCLTHATPGSPETPGENNTNQTITTGMIPDDYTGDLYV